MPKEYIDVIHTIYLIIIEITQITLLFIAIYFMLQVTAGKIKININIEKINKEK